MAQIVGVHGINQEYRGSHTIHAEWLPALKDGLDRVGMMLEDEKAFACAFYGDLFRGATKSFLGVPNYDVNDIDSDWERQILWEWWQEAAKTESGIMHPDDLKRTKATPGFIQQALNALSASKFFGGIAEKFVINYLKQVGGYLTNPVLRNQIRERVAESIDEDTRILIGHSEVDPIGWTKNEGSEALILSCVLSSNHQILPIDSIRSLII